MRRVVPILPLASWLGAACSFDVEVLYPADAAVVDAAPPADAPVANTDAGGLSANLLDDPSFESGGDPWTPYGSALSGFPVLPKTGTKSLAVCKSATGSASDFSTYVDLYNEAAADLPAGQGFVVRVWVRGAPVLGPVPDAVQLVLRERGGPSVKRDHVMTLPGVTSDWQQVELSAAITDAGRTGLSLIVQALGEPDGTCFLLDEVFAARML